MTSFQANSTKTRGKSGKMEIHPTQVYRRERVELNITQSKECDSSADFQLIKIWWIKHKTTTNQNFVPFLQTYIIEVIHYYSNVTLCLAVMAKLWLSNCLAKRKSQDNQAVLSCQFYVNRSISKKHMKREETKFGSLYRFILRLT